MVANHIHHALEQVYELRHKILERQRFRGYSGAARIVSGVWALLAAAVLSSSLVPQTAEVHILGWGIVCGVGVFMNYGAVGYRFLTEQTAVGSIQNIRRLRPTLDGIAPLVVGGLLTVAVLDNGHYQYLFGVWMSLFGLTNIASRHVLPPKISLVGCFYIVCGAVCLFSPGNLPGNFPGDAPGDSIHAFLNPWPMGIVFFVGECAGGMLLYLDERTGPALSHRPAQRAERLENSYANKT